MPEEKDLRCRILDARDICQRIAEHVAALCISSNDILKNISKESSNGTLRNAFVLTLLALEETGKLFRVWQAAANVEDHASDLIVRDLFSNHQAKGGLAGDLCCQMLDYTYTVLGSDSESQNLNSVQRGMLAEARDHLKETYQDFKTIREIVMYTANDQERCWHGMSTKVGRNIGVENLLLMMVASGAQAYLESGGRFSLATKGLLDIQKGVHSDDAFAFTGRMAYGFLKLAGKEKEEV